MRNEMIKLLDSLGSDEDDEVLQAARQLHAQVMEAGLSWQDLLAPDDSTGTPEDHVEDDDGNGGEATADPGPDDAASLKLIAELLAIPDCSDDLRNELAGYEADIRNGQLDEADRRYINALHKRLAL